MSTDGFWGNIFKKKEDRELTTLDILRKVPIFSDLSQSELKALERIVHKRSYQINEVVFNMGEPGVGMYIIEQGAVSIALPTSEKENYKELALLKDGDFFGELALLDEEPRSATAIAKQPTQLIGFFHPDLFGILETKPKTGIKILLKLASMIGERLRNQNKELQRLKSVGGK
jgi:CRP-like cAMP-binding protein